MAQILHNISSVFAVIILELVVMTIFWNLTLPPTLEKPESYCDVVNSSLVRKLVEKRWMPVLNRYGVSLPLQCPLNLARDMLGTRELLKKRKSSHWKCRKCGKTFYHERYLDLHIDKKHRTVNRQMDDSSVCFGSFCDVIRCDVLMSTAVFGDDFVSTDLSLWTPNLGDYQGDTKVNQQPVQDLIDYSHDAQLLNKSAGTGSHETNDCDENYFLNLRQKCSALIWECLQGLISILDAHDFRVIQDELETTSCSYLSCSRFVDKHCQSYSRFRGPLRPFIIVFGALLISLCLALSYYFAWIYTQSSDEIYNTRNQKTSARLESNLQLFHGSQSRSLVNRTTHI